MGLPGQPRIVVLALACLLVVATSLFILSSRGAARTGPLAVRVLYTSGTQGYLKACG